MKTLSTILVLIGFLLAWWGMRNSSEGSTDWSWALVTATGFALLAVAGLLIALFGLIRVFAG